MVPEWDNVYPSGLTLLARLDVEDIEGIELTRLYHLYGEEVEKVEGPGGHSI